jgi:hypothetical protein
MMLLAYLPPAHALSPEDALKNSAISGGLVVHAGCTTGEFTAGLHTGRGILVHGLCPNAADVERAREYIRSRGLYGEVSVDIFDGEHLPYANGIVNAVIVSGDNHGLSPGEVERVLEPGGTVLLEGTWDPGESSLGPDQSRNVPGWTTWTKPWPEEIDGWTHYLHGPDGNQVARDTMVGPPRHIQWRAKPYWGRQHRYGNKTAMVSANGRLFYVSNEIEPCIEKLPDRPFLVARDAFSGVLLWKQPIRPSPMKGRLESSLGLEDCFLFEPAFPMETKVVADDDCVYVAFGPRGDLLALGATTGKLLRTYEDTAGTEEVLCSAGKLLTVMDRNGLEKWRESARTLNDLIRRRQRADTIRVIDSRTGLTSWEYDTSRGPTPSASSIPGPDSLPGNMIRRETVSCRSHPSSEVEKCVRSWMTRCSVSISKMVRRYGKSHWTASRKKRTMDCAHCSTLRDRPSMII